MTNFLRIQVCLIFIFFLSCRSFAQQTTLFDIEVAKIKVGSLVTEKVVKDSMTIYIFRSEVDAGFIMRVKVSHTISCVYIKNKLVRADIHSVINQDKYVSSVAWNKDHYDYDCSTYKYHKTGVLTRDIDFSVVKMYFEEPLVTGAIFAENYGVLCPLLCSKPSTYHLDVDKNSNTFHYANGLIQRVEMETPLFNYVIRRKT
jgi:hypothetical protein